MIADSRPLARRAARTLRLAAAAALFLAACAPDDSPPADAPPAIPAETDVPATAPAGPTDSTAAPAEPSETILTADGWGPIRIGMTRADVVAAAGEDANPNAVGGPEPEACDEFRPERAPEGLLVMIERDTLTRITLSDGTGITTDRGFGVGAAADEVESAYGADAVVTPHKYVEAPAEYITVWTTAAPPAPDARGIVYEVGSDGRVEHIHAGGPSIQYVEGCL